MDIFISNGLYNITKEDFLQEHTKAYHKSKDYFIEKANKAIEKSENRAALVQGV